LFRVKHKFGPVRPKNRGLFFPKRARKKEKGNTKNQQPRIKGEMEFLH